MQQLTPTLTLTPTDPNPAPQKTRSQYFSKFDGLGPDALDGVSERLSALNHLAIRPLFQALGLGQTASEYRRLSKAELTKRIMSALAKSSGGRDKKASNPRKGRALQRSQTKRRSKRKEPEPDDDMPGSETESIQEPSSNSDDSDETEAGQAIQRQTRRGKGRRGKREAKQTTGSASKPKKSQIGSAKRKSRDRDSIAKPPAFSTPRRQRVNWTDGEVSELKRLVRKHQREMKRVDTESGKRVTIPWSKILSEGAAIFNECRTQGDLKDKWRNMNKKPTNKVKKKYILLNGDLQTFSNVYPRDAAKKAASRGYTKIDLLEASKGIVHLFRGWRDRIEEDRSENHSENLWGRQFVPNVQKVGTQPYGDWALANRGASARYEEKREASLDRQRAKNKARQKVSIKNEEEVAASSSTAPVKRRRAKRKAPPAEDTENPPVRPAPKRSKRGASSAKSKKASKKTSQKRAKDVLDGYSFLLTKLRDDEKDARALIQTMGGVVLDTLEDAASAERNGGRVVVLSDKERTTKKFIFSLALGLAPLRVGWLQACWKAKECVDPSSFAISFGRPKDTDAEQLIPDEWDSLVDRGFLAKLPKRARVLSGKKIAVAYSSDSFFANVRSVLVAAGADVVRAHGKMSAKTARALYCVICEKSVDRVPNSVNCDVVQFAWVLECLQRQEIVPFAVDGVFDFAAF